MALRKIREGLGVSIVSVAKKAGISDAMLSRIERGERISPHFTTVAKIAKVLGVSLDEVAEEANIPIARPRSARSTPPSLDIRQSETVDLVSKHLQQAFVLLAKLQE